MQKNNPIGVFDSGVGGLTVAKEIMRLLPYEHIVYFGDTARVPYGTKSREAIIRFSKQNVGILLKHEVKMVVVACNSSSSHALPALKSKFKVPILGVIEPGAKKAAATTKNKRIGVIATKATINSQSYARQIKKYGRSFQVTGQACPLFVPLAEEGWFKYRETFMIAERYLQPLKKAGVDTVILGCTHYPLLKPVLQKVIGRRVSLIDSAKEVAVEVKKLLEKNHALRTQKTKPRYEFLISDERQHFQKLAKRFLGGEIRNVKRVSV